MHQIPQAPIDNEKLNTILKKIVISLGVMFLLGVVFLVIAFFLKQNNQTEAKQTSNSVGNQSTELLNSVKNSAFPTGCGPITVEFKDSYIALHSKQCRQINIINPRNNSTSSIKY